MLKAFAAFGGACGVLLIANKVYFSGGKCYETGRLDGKLAIVTGANGGIGKETTAELVRRGAIVIMACRNLERAEAAKVDIVQRYGEGQPSALTTNVVNSHMCPFLSPVKPEQLIVESLDLSSLNSVRDFVSRVSAIVGKVDILVNNAGIMACPYGETKDGFEMQMGTNHLGPFLLTELLLPLIKRAGPGSRIIFVSSRAHLRTKSGLVPLNGEKAAYSRFNSYCRSKLANVMYSSYLAKRLETDGIKTASVHPGVVQTDLFKLPESMKTILRFVTRPFMKTPWEGAQTTLYTILVQNLKSGAYYSDCALSNPSPIVFDEKATECLIAASRKAVGLD
uniref:Ovule protein n=1 Tax=Mesocestoides corti TaxID=53468 RepID=A0A5K3FXM6_MESCO